MTSKPGMREIAVNLDPETYQFVEALADVLERPKAEIVRKMVAQSRLVLLAARQMEVAA